MRLKAKMTFHNRGAYVRQGEEFNATESDGRYLIDEGFAEEVTKSKSMSPSENKAKKRKVDEE